VEPWVGSLARCQQTRFDEFSALADRFVIHDREELILADPRPDSVTYRGDGGFSTGHADLQTFDLFRCLDGAKGEDFALAVTHCEPAFFECQCLNMTASVHTDFVRSRCMNLHKVGDLVGEGSGGLVIPARYRRPDELARPCLIHGLKLGAHMIALGVFEENDRTLSRYKKVARGVAQEIAEHVS